jgi:hypothetical protein
MTRGSLLRLAVLPLSILLLPACTTMQTTYFRASYVELAKADAPGLVPHGTAEPGFSLVQDMKAKEREMYGEGYAMLGYSQFVSPLLTSLAESYSTKWGVEVGAAHVVLETPRAGESNLHYFLVTYWAARKREPAGLGAYLVDLPPELLERIGKSLNVVMVQQVVKGGLAAEAGLRANDVLLALDDERVMSVQQFTGAVGARAGEEIVLNVSRADQEIELPLRLKAAVRPDPGYREAPWLATQPKDWSMFSAASFTASAVQVARQQEQQRQLEYARADAQAQRNLASLESRRADAALSSDGRRGATSQPYSSRRGGDNPNSPTAGRMPTQDEMSRNYQEFVDKWRRNWNSPEAREARERREATEAWWHAAPHIYYNLYKFPPPRMVF